MANVSVKGGVTKTKIFVGPESHKLHLEFDLSPDPSAAAIHAGQPVTLAKVTYDSSDYDVITPAAGDADQSAIIGISIHELDSAYQGSIVVATRGYAVVFAKVKGAVSAGAKLTVGDGATTPVLYDTDSGYCWVSAAAAAADTYGWALESAADGAVIKVLVKN